jgi:hypothetical protein
MDTPDYSHQATISALHAEIDGKDKIIAEYQKQVQTLNDRATANYRALSDLQYAIKYFFEANREDDNFEFDINEANAFLVENGMDALKREYRVSFTIEGVFVIEAENEEEASAIADELDVSHYTAEIEYFNAEATSVDTQF